MTTELRVSVRSTSDIGGTPIAPMFAFFHDGSFDVYDLGTTASAGLEELAEEGSAGGFEAEMLATDPDGQVSIVNGGLGPVITRELASSTTTVDGTSNGFLGLAAMLLPSNDAFIGTAEGVQLFDASGMFQGAQTIVFDGASVRDSGTEVNTELDAPFINQANPGDGVTEGGLVTVHPGFNGSAGNPGGNQIILGGTNSFGGIIDPIAADFTLPGAMIATVHVNTIATQTGGSGQDSLTGRADDDFINGNGGNDTISGATGWDVLNGGDGEDVIFGDVGDDQIDGGNDNDALFGEIGYDDIAGGLGDDLVSGGAGDDNLFGGAGSDSITGDGDDDLIDGGADDDFLLGGTGADYILGDDGSDFINGESGNDTLIGGSGADTISGGSGNDLLAGGTGNDVLWGGADTDAFFFAQGDEADLIFGFDPLGDDQIVLSVAGIENYSDVEMTFSDLEGSVLMSFGNGDFLVLVGVGETELSSADFMFL